MVSEESPGKLLGLGDWIAKANSADRARRLILFRVNCVVPIRLVLDCIAAFFAAPCL